MDFPATIWAGLVGGGVMVVILYMGIGMMPSQMKMNLLYLLGSMMVKQKVMAYMAGAMIHAMMSIAFALAHVGVFEALDVDSYLLAWGLLFGLVHYLVVGMALGMIPMMHPRIRSGDIQAPGAYALSYPKMTAAGFLMLHLLFGLLVGGFYDLFGGV